MVDIDHFKAVNDTFGHEAGDRALIAITRLLTARTRPSDVVARWGGEEFVIALDDRTAQEAARFAEDLRREVAQSALDEVEHLTISVGLAQMHMDETLGALLERADKALYAAKAQGRDCLVTAP